MGFSKLLLIAFVTTTFGIEIDWTRCVEDTHCHAVGKCFANRNSDDLLPVLFISNLPASTCKIGLQLKPYSTAKMLFILQYKDKLEINNGKEPALVLYKGKTKLFGCTTKDGEIVLDLGDLDLKTYKIGLYDGSMLTADVFICAFTVDNYDGFSQTVLQQFANELTIMNFYADSKSNPAHSSQEEGVGNNALETKQKHITCNPDDLAEELFVNDPLYVVRIHEPARKILDCSNIQPLTHKLYYYEDGDANSKEAEHIYCDKKQWKIKAKDGTIVDIPKNNPEKFSFVCGIPITRSCAPFNCTGENCPKNIKASDTADPSLECPDGKWKIDGKYETNVKINCEADDQQVNHAIFTMTFPSGSKEVLPADAKCFEKYDCNEHSPLDLNDCTTEDETCVVLQKSNNTIDCADEIPLIVQMRGSNSSTTTKKVTCDEDDGKWKDFEGKEVPTGAYVRCKEKSIPVAQAAMSAGSVYGWIAAIIIGGFIAIGAAAYGYYFARRKRREQKLKPNERKWRQMNTVTRIAVAKNLFEKFLTVTPFTEETIVDGLEFFEMLLHTETEEPEIWEEAWKFIVRLHGCLNQIDDVLEQLFIKFCFVEAKKIIRTHEWISDHPITKKNTNGYIRVVGISLLGRAIYSKENDEAVDMVLEGFSELKYSLTTQYPHAGLLLSIVGQITAPEFEANGQVQKQISKMTYDLYKLVHVAKIFDQEDDLAQFGSIKRQLLVAMGSHREVCAIPNTVAKLFEHDHGLWFAEGLVKATCPNPTRVFGGIYKRAVPKKNRLDDMLVLKKGASVEKLANYFTMAADILINFGQNMDAKNLYARCLGENEDFKSHYYKKRAEYRAFEAACEEKREEIYSWLVARVGKEVIPTYAFQESKIEDS